MTNFVRVVFTLIILASVLVRQSSSKNFENVPFLNHMEGVVLAQSATIVETRKKTQAHGFITFMTPSCLSPFTIIPFNITHEAKPILTVHGFEDSPFSVSYLDYSGPYPGKLRLFMELLRSRVMSSFGAGRQLMSTKLAILIAHQGDCDLSNEIDTKLFWLTAEQNQTKLLRPASIWS